MFGTLQTSYSFHSNILQTFMKISMLPLHSFDYLAVKASLNSVGKILDLKDIYGFNSLNENSLFY